MFGEFEYGAGLFGDGAGSPVTPTPTPETFQRLRVECKTLTCDGQPDTSFYSIQDPIPSRIVAAAECQNNDCTGIAPDSQSYSIQDALLFNGTPLTVPVTCPEGATCTPGSFPPTVTYPPETFVFPEVPVIPGQPINLCLQGCQSNVCRFLPAGSSQAAIQAAANAIMLEVALQQAQCDVFPEFPFGTTVQLTDLESFACLGLSFSDSVLAIVTPASYPATFSIIGGSLPAGITMSQNGTAASFTGTATTAGASNFTLRATSANGVSGTRAYSITVVGITTASPLPGADVGIPYSEALASVGISGTLIWGVASGSLPDGLTIDPATGVISGTPTTSETASFTVFVQNSEQQCAKAFTLEVAAGECVINTTSPFPDGTIGVPYSHTLTASGISAPLTWSITLGNVPNGLSLNAATGEVSGTPTTEEFVFFDVLVDNGTTSCPKNFEMIVNPDVVCPDWNPNLLWGAATVSNGTFDPNNGTGQFITAVVNAGGGQSANVGEIEYNGGGCDCNIHIELTGQALPSDLVCKVSLDQVAPFVPLVCFAAFGAAAGSYDIPFTLPNTLGATVTIQMIVNISQAAGAGTTMTILVDNV